MLGRDAVATIANLDTYAIGYMLDRYRDYAPVITQVRDRVHRIEHQIDGDLLYLNAVADDASRRHARIQVECHASTLGLGAQKVHRVPDGFVWIEQLAFEVVLGKQRPQSANHIAGAQVVAADVAQYPAQVFAPVCARLKEQLPGIGISQYCPERLIDLVGNRGRQLSGNCKPRCVPQLAALFLYRQLGLTAAPVFKEKHRNQRSLEEDHRSDDDRLVSIRLPERRLPEIDDGIGRNCLLVDSPATDLSPIEPSRHWLDFRQVQRRRRGTGQQLRENLRGSPTYGVETL